MAIPEFIRELRPHVTFWVLEKLAGGLLIAAVLALVEFTRSHLDVASLFAAFLGAVVVLVWIDRKKIHASHGNPGPLKAVPTLTIISARWGIGATLTKT